jgi:hypothetical protein
MTNHPLALEGKSKIFLFKENVPLLSLCQLQDPWIVFSKSLDIKAGEIKKNASNGQYVWQQFNLLTFSKLCNGNGTPN